MNHNTDYADEPGIILANVPEAEITPELCLEAVKQDGYALFSVPEKFKTIELCVAALSEYNYFMEHSPYPIETDDLYRPVPDSLKDAVRNAMREVHKNDLKTIEAEKQKGRELLAAMKNPKKSE